MTESGGGGLRWGILGTASIAPALVSALGESERSTLVAIASRNLRKAEDFALSYTIPRFYGSYEELVDDPSIDVLYIPVPNKMHGEWTVRALTAGKHVLCEKPLVTSLREFELVESTSRTTGLTVVEAFMSLHHPQAARAKELLGSGVIGQPRLVEGRFGYGLPLGERDNIKLRADTDGGSFWDVGVYPNSYINYLLGTPPASATAAKVSRIGGVDTGFAGQLIFPDGIIGQIWSSLETFFQQGVRVIGEDGVIDIPVPWMPGMTDRTHVGEDTHITVTTDSGTETICFPASNPFLAEVVALENQVLDGAPPVVSLAQSRAFLQSALALQEAAATGRAIAVSA